MITIFKKYYTFKDIYYVSRPASLTFNIYLAYLENCICSRRYSICGFGLYIFIFFNELKKVLKN